MSMSLSYMMIIVIMIVKTRTSFAFPSFVFHVLGMQEQKRKGQEASRSLSYLNGVSPCGQGLGGEASCWCSPCPG